MSRNAWLLPLACLLVSTGCPGDGGGDDPSTATETEGGEVSSSGGDSTGAGTGTSADTTSGGAESGAETGSSTGGSSDLTIEGDGFGNVDQGTGETRSFAVTNTFAEPVSGLALSTTGVFAISTNDCPEALPSGETCTVVVSLGAEPLGPYPGTLEATFDGGVRSVDITAHVVGNTANLLQDGEFGCYDDWEDVGAGSWRCIGGTAGSPPHSGQSFLSGYEGPDNQDYIYRQRVDLSEWSELLGYEFFKVELRGWVRNSSASEFRLRVEYLSAAGEVRATYDSDYQAQPIEDWQEWVDRHAATDDSVEALVSLYCRKSDALYCNVDYDAFSLVGVYEGEQAR